LDQFLIDYLKSGRAWLLVGSGPSIDAGYPSWSKLAEVALATARADHPGVDLRSAERSFQRGDFPGVFEEAWRVLGGPRLRQALSGHLTCTGGGKVYDLLARWPVPVYLTTNYEDALQGKLAALGEHYVSYANSADHLAHLTPELTGGIFKLHGDLHSDDGLILTRSQYSSIASGVEWQHWRTKLTSVFQMNRVIVVGHSLTDPHVKHILQAAKQGAGVTMPVCWLTADATPEQTREYLEKFRIRLIPYDNRDGTHRNLLRLVEQVSQFVPPRTAVRLSHALEQATVSPLGVDAAAPGFFVFNRLAAREEHEDERCAVLVAALQATIGKLATRPQFTLEYALGVAGWPPTAALEPRLIERLAMTAVEKRLFERTSTGQLRVNPDGVGAFEKAHADFDHLRQRFLGSLQLRARRLFPDLAKEDAKTIARDLDTSLTAYFRHGGLTLATTLLARSPDRNAVIPGSIIGFITEASARYDDLLRRQAFCTVSVDAFVNAQSAEREYLGRMAQGFFAFHSLGVLGEVAQQRVLVAKETAWVLDSNVLIPVLALGSSANATVRATLDRLSRSGIRMFATEKLFHEAWEHLHFARDVVRKSGRVSPDVIAAATGQAPYRKTNRFLEGFLSWQASGGRSDWEAYLHDCFGQRTPTPVGVREALRRHGVDVVPLQDWPGFTAPDFEARDSYTERIVQERERNLGAPLSPAERKDIERKALPEAEALLVVKNQRSGRYYVLSNDGRPSQAWFISDTAILNRIETAMRITWQPEAFLRFAATLPSAESMESSDAFGTILWAVAEAGVSLVDEQTVATVFGGLIDGAKVKLEEQKQLYEQTLAEKYGESASAVLERLRPSARPMAALQLTHELLTQEGTRRAAAEAVAENEKRRRDAAERELRELARLKRKLDKKASRKRPRKKARH
jgi:hypothetical protein